MKSNRTNQNGGILLFLAVCTLIPTEVHAQTVVTFPDPNLEAAVRQQLAKPAGPITSIDLQSLTTLNASQSSITNLAGLEWATNLDSLYLYANHLTDIGPLTHLTALTVVDVRINLLDLSPGSPA